jgi:hypothetical protein
MFLKNSKKIIFLLIAALGLLLFFSYRLTSIPDGITVDEASFGYNGTLLARTLRDENNRKLPIFVLSIGGSDWRQPVTQYFTAFIFKIFGPSLSNLRMTAVITAVASIILIYLLGKQLFGNVGAVAASVFLATTPIFMIQSHLALDNIAPLPFVILWLLGLFMFDKTKKNPWLIVSAISLGIGFYSYKSMRIFVPVWVILSLIYLAQDFVTKISKGTLKKVIKPVLIFSLGILPFFVIIPFLEYLYAGAVLNKANPEINNIYSFVSFYLSNFDPSFLFVKGDDLLFHSTGRHGMYLLMSLPFFILGLASSWKKSSFWKLIIVSFFLGPLMFGYIGQVHRASRLLALIPLYSLVAGSGFLHLWQKRLKILIGILTIFFAINYFDFIHYYFINYAKDTKAIFYNFEIIDQSFKTLKEESIKRGLTPYVDQVIMKGLNPTRDFAKSIYFGEPLNTWNGAEKEYPEGAILMTDNSKVEFLKQIEHIDRYYFYIKE